MAVCSGTSQVKAGVAPAVIVDNAYIKNLLPAALSWLYDYLPFMHGLSIGDTSAFCSVDPPTFTVPSTDDLANFLIGGPIGATQTVSTFLQNLTRAYLWYQLCECSSGSPTPLTPPTKPTGLPAVNPFPYVTPNTGTPCRQVSFAFHFAGPPTGGADFTLTPFALSDVKPTLLRWTQTEQQNGFSLASRSNWWFTTDGTDPMTSGTRTAHQFSPKDSFFDFTIPSGATTFRLVDVTSVAGGFSIDVTGQLDFYCGGQLPNAATTPCCPPDPLVTGYLQQILDLATLLQRQLVPFSYVTGATHTGLSGAGALSISGLLGVKVAVTTLPTSYGVAGTSPPEHFDLGFLTFGTPDGFPSAYRLTRNPQFLAPPRCSVYTDLDYDLAPGVVVTITELEREP